MADRSVVYRLQADVTSFRAQMAAAGKSVGDAAGKMTAANKEGAQFRQGLDTLGGAAGKVGLVAAAGLGAAVAASANFDQAMSNVKAATHETAANMDRLREAALQAGADTAFSATEAAAGVENLAKAGISTADILGGGLTGALDLAAAGEMDVAAAAETAATALTQFKLQGQDVPHVADLLAAAAGKAQGDVSDMAMALKQGGLVAAQTGLTIEETTGTLAAFASAGLVGSDAGTSFKTMLQALTPTGKKAADLMAELGITAYDAAGNFVGMEAFAASLSAGLSHLSVEQQNAAMKTIFGSDAVRAASVVFQQGAEGVGDWIEKVDDSGYAAETAATRLDNLKGDLEAFMGSLETALIGTGDGAQGPLRSLVQNATDAVNVFNDLSPAAKNVTGSLLGITAILGGGLWFGSKVIGGIASTKLALSQLGVTAGVTRSALIRTGAAAGGMAALSMTELDEKAGVANTAMLTLAGTMFGPWGAAAGFAVGAVMDLDAANVSLGETIDAVQKKIDAYEPGMDLAPITEGVTEAEAKLAQFRADIDGYWTTTDFGNALKGWKNDLEGLFGDSDVEEFEAAIRGLAFESAKLKGEWDGNWVHDALDIDANVGDKYEHLSTAMDQTAGAGAKLAARMERQEEALGAAREAAAETAVEFIGMGDSLDDAKTSLGGWLKELENQAAALRNFRVNAQAAAKKGLDEGLIASLHEMGPAGALRMRQLANATQGEIGRANKAWKAGQNEIERYTNAIGGVPTKVDTRVNLETGAAMTGINNLEARLNAIADEDVYINIRHRSDGRDTGMGPQHRAHGGPVYGPGTATSDSIPAMLSDGEFVVRTAAVERYGVDFFHRLNAMKFASGGHATRATTATLPAPNVSVGGAQVRVFIDGQEVRATVRSEINRHQTKQRNARGYGR